MDPKAFLGQGWKFPLQLDPSTGEFAKAEGEENIAESVKLIIMTSCGERVMRPRFGTRVREYMFHIINQELFFDLQRNITESLSRDEPRIRDIDVDIEQAGDTGEVHIRVEYTIRNTNNRYNQVFPFYLIDG